ncbi:hypothetical protein [Sphingomonas sp. Ant20]|uniref:hypothetical protein n=1 Tax=Sphingomonas sp. Ant20 TaxID=104605 RepID=UPI0018E2F532|nr:hypothetical protein [Sphingomonas sp. Ant20]
MKRMNMAALVAVATVLAHPFRTLAAAASTKPEPKLRLTAPTLPAMPRAIAGTVRADGSDPATLIRALNGAFDEFKTTHAREIEEIKAGKTDVLTKDKLDAINATLTELQTAVDDQARINAAAKLGDGAIIGDIKPIRTTPRRSRRTCAVAITPRPRCGRQCRRAPTPTAAIWRRSNGIARSARS